MSIRKNFERAENLRIAIAEASLQIFQFSQNVTERIICHGPALLARVAKARRQRLRPSFRADWPARDPSRASDTLATWKSQMLPEKRRDLPGVDRLSRASRQSCSGRTAATPGRDRFRASLSLVNYLMRQIDGKGQIVFRCNEAYRTLLFMSRKLCRNKGTGLIGVQNSRNSSTVRSVSIPSRTCCVEIPCQTTSAT